MGRPAGSRNRRSDAAARVVAAAHGALPVDYLAALAMPSRDQVERARGDKREAWEAHVVELARLQEGGSGRKAPSAKAVDAARALAYGALKELATYVHPKQAAIATEHTGDPVVVAFGDMRGPAGGDQAKPVRIVDAPSRAMPADLLELQQNQGLALDFGVASHDRPSHEGSRP